MVQQQTVAVDTGLEANSVRSVEANFVEVNFAQRQVVHTWAAVTFAEGADCPWAVVTFAPGADCPWAVVTLSLVAAVPSCQVEAMVVN